MKLHLGQFVARRWKLILLLWGTAVVLIALFVPKWDDVTVDGDLAYMPEEMPNVLGQALIQEAFPDRRAKSQMVLVLARRDGPLTVDDFQVADQMALPFYIFRAARGLARVEELRAEHRESVEENERRIAKRIDEQITTELNESLVLLDKAIEIDGHNADAYHNRALIQRELGNLEEADDDARIAIELNGELAESTGKYVPAGAGDWPILDVWTRQTDLVGEKMLSKDRQACLVVLQLSNEFMVHDNCRLLLAIQEKMDAVRQNVAENGPDGLQIQVTGSAAVGADFVLAEGKSIENTEMYTVILVVAILGLLYRAPLLVAVPLTAIGVSLTVGTGVIILLTQVSKIPGMGWWHYEIFSATKVFIVVILFGAGTDFCLFLIARYREELGRGKPADLAIADALDGVDDALLGSAMTTILGLGMMYFADFGKFSIAGPTIGICLAVALLGCLTLAPAMLRAFGLWAFWPFDKRLRKQIQSTNSSPSPEGQGIGYVVWDRLAGVVITYPGRVLTFTLLLLLPFAWYGGDVPPLAVGFTDVVQQPDNTTTDDDRLAATTDWMFPPAAWYRQRVGRERFSYDLVGELPPDSASRQGMQVLQDHFPIGETGPLAIIAKKEDAGFETSEGMAAIEELTKQLYVDGVESVRSIAEPLGEIPKRFSLVSPRGQKKLLLRTHPLSRRQYLTDVPALVGDVVRFELLLAHNPFSIEATQTLNQVDDLLTRLSASTDPFWQGMQFAYTGTTSGVRDLRTVTRGDSVRIKVLVVLAVFGVLIALIRSKLISAYLILFVLFSYYVTLGMTELFFSYFYGSSFHGLDWKVNIFLFVILVAIGQDYNIYLITRVLEEQKKLGPIAGLRRAIVQTGSIITSCGVIMAGTFFSMTTGSLRAMVEMGFALALGVLIDTFVVRTLIVPSFLALIFKHKPTSLKIFNQKPAKKAEAEFRTA